MTERINLSDDPAVFTRNVNSEPKIIYLKRTGGNTVHNPLIPGVRLGQNVNTKIIFNSNLGAVGGNMPRIISPSGVRNSIHLKKISNINLTSGTKILVTNQPPVYRSVTPVFVNVANTVAFNQPNTIIHQLTANQSNQISSKPKPRLHSPDKDSFDDSQENMDLQKIYDIGQYTQSVCDKVKEKGITTYSEIADELVHEYANEYPIMPHSQLHLIQKNIRRRVYDSINVLLGLKVFEKEKKEIKWKGLPVNLLEECKRLEEKKMKKSEQLQQKVEELSELIFQLISYKNLVGRNRQTEKEGSAPPLNERIRLPFLVITTNNDTLINCNISPEKLDWTLMFDQPFEMQDEFQTLIDLGFTLSLGTTRCTESQYKRCLELVPNTLRFYVEAIYQQQPAVIPDFVSLHRQNLTTQVHCQDSKMLSREAGGSSSYNNPCWSGEYLSQKPFEKLSIDDCGDDRLTDVGNTSFLDQLNNFNKQFVNNPTHEFVDDVVEVMDEEDFQ